MGFVEGLPAFVVGAYCVVRLHCLLAEWTAIVSLLLFVFYPVYVQSQVGPNSTIVGQSLLGSLYVLNGSIDFDIGLVSSVGDSVVLLAANIGLVLAEGMVSELHYLRPEG